jgi:hypothetical protein
LVEIANALLALARQLSALADVVAAVVLAGAIADAIKELTKRVL